MVMAVPSYRARLSQRERSAEPQAQVPQLYHDSRMLPDLFSPSFALRDGLGKMMVQASSHAGCSAG